MEPQTNSTTGIVGVFPYVILKRYKGRIYCRPVIIASYINRDGAVVRRSWGIRLHGITKALRAAAAWRKTALGI